VEAQFYAALPVLLLLLARRRAAGIVTAVGVILGGLILRSALGYAHPAADGYGVSGRAFQNLIYYPTWTRLDSLVLGVSLASIEQFRPRWWVRLLGEAHWLWLPGIAAVAFGLFLGDGDVLPIAACVWQFPLVALGMSLLLVCAVSERLPFHRVPIPGVALVASIAYSVYLSHKLVIHQVVLLCALRSFPLTSASVLVLDFTAIIVIGSLLYFAVERPFLLLRRRNAVRALPRVTAVPEPSA
jgi:peptidoglycan/LPS O-acetylase OafA/YrhL